MSRICFTVKDSKDFRAMVVAIKMLCGMDFVRRELQGPWRRGTYVLCHGLGGSRNDGFALDGFVMLVPERGVFPEAFLHRLLVLETNLLGEPGEEKSKTLAREFFNGYGLEPYDFTHFFEEV